MARQQRSKRFTAVVGGKKRDMVWVPWQVELSTVLFQTLDVLSADMLANFFGNTGAELAVGTTIMRIRGSFLMLGVAASQLVQGSMAMLMVREDGTFAELLMDEMLHPLWRHDINEKALLQAVGAGTFSVIPARYEIDSKAKRKVRETGERLQWLAFTSVSTSSASISVQGSGSILLMLP